MIINKRGIGLVEVEEKREERREKREERRRNAESQRDQRKSEVVIIYVLIFMGGGGTLVEGIRRLFQRRASNSVETHNNANNSRVYVRDLRAQLPSIPNHHHLVDPDFDFSTLKPIKVPAQIPFRPSSMDLHKKVIFSSPHLFFFLPATSFLFSFPFLFHLFYWVLLKFRFLFFPNPLLYRLL